MNEFWQYSALHMDRLAFIWHSFPLPWVPMTRNYHFHCCSPIDNMRVLDCGTGIVRQFRVGMGFTVETGFGLEDLEGWGFVG